MRISTGGRHDLGAAAPFSTKRLPYKGEREVRPSRLNKSRSSVGLEPFVQYSYPRASLELLWRRPPCARESKCLRARLPAWRDVAAERLTPGLLHADPSISYLLPSRSTFHLLIEMGPHTVSVPARSIESFFKHSVYIRQRGFARPEFFLLGDETIALRDSLALLPWHRRVTSTSRTLV